MVWDVCQQKNTLNNIDIPTVSVHEEAQLQYTSLSFLLDTGFLEGHGLKEHIHLSLGLSPAYHQEPTLPMTCTHAQLLFMWHQS